MHKSELTEYRVRMLAQLLKSADDFCAACREAGDINKVLGPSGWTVHQLAAHVRDMDRESYGIRARRTLLEENPSFPKFHADLWAAQHYNAEEPLEKILDEFHASIHEMVEQLKSQPQSAWSRLGRHEIQGERTLQIWVERDLAHIREHFETVKQRHE